MNNLIRAEVRTLTTIRSWWLLATGVALFPLLSLLALATSPESEQPVFGTDTIFMLVRGGADVAAVAALVLGIIAVTSEYRHGTIVPALLASPRRVPFIGAKLVTMTLAGAVMAIGAAAVSVVAGSLYLSSQGVDVYAVSAGDITLAGIGVVAGGALFGAIGAGLGALIRHQTAAVTGMLVWILAVEGILPMVTRDPGLRDWMLTGASSRLFRLADPAEGMASPWTAAVLLVTVATVLGAAALTAMRTTDVQAS